MSITKVEEIENRFESPFKSDEGRWPEGKRFAFSVFDDTDLSTLENSSGIYSQLQDLGFRTTKSVWPLAGKGPGKHSGATCADPQYRNWLLKLQEAGFEIGFHNATFHTSLRDETILALDTFRQLFGHDPNCMANHSGCKEAIYWGNNRLSGWHEKAYKLFRPLQSGAYRGHNPADPTFWGDYCKSRIKYVRNFVFPHINTLKSCPAMPYHDPERPFVNYWFASSEGPCVESFNRCISERNQERLEEEGGACIMYTHFGNGFQQNGSVNRKSSDLLLRLSKKNGWFVPVSTLLDHLLQQGPVHTIEKSERAKMERRWIWHKIWSGGTT